MSGAKRVKVTEPYTGVELDVPADSPQAKSWAAPAKKAPAREKSDSKK